MARKRYLYAVTTHIKWEGNKHWDEDTLNVVAPDISTAEKKVDARYEKDDCVRDYGPLLEAIRIGTVDA